MLSNRQNFISRFFETLSDLWHGAQKYQVLVLLAAVGVLVFLISLQGTQDGGNIVFNLIFFCLLAAAGFAALWFKGSAMASFAFAAALILRISLIFAFQHSVPYMCNDDRSTTYRWIRHYDSAILQADEFLYAHHSRFYKNVTLSEFIHYPEFLKNAYRTSFLMSRVFRIFGDNFTWLRIVGAFLGAFTAAFLTLSAEYIFSRKTVSAVISMLSVFAPQAAFYSVRFLKESWLMFAVSLLLLGFTAIIFQKKIIRSVLPITVALLILLWVRLEYALMFIAIIPAAICFKPQTPLPAKIAAGLVILLTGTLILLWPYDRISSKAERLYDRFTLSNNEPRGRLEVMDDIYRSRGPLRILNLPLAVLNPPPKNLHNIFTPKNGLYDVVLQADIWQWWLPLPFLIIGSIVTIARRRKFLVFLVPYLIVITVASLLLGGLLPVVYRFRDSLSPFAFIIIGLGIDSFLSRPELWKKSTIAGVYAVFVMLAVYFSTV